MPVVVHGKADMHITIIILALAIELMEASFKTEPPRILILIMA